MYENLFKNIFKAEYQNQKYFIIRRKILNLDLKVRQKTGFLNEPKIIICMKLQT